jgi:ABC-type multidrug transport system fused ATPase/permease subunit
MIKKTFQIIKPVLQENSSVLFMLAVLGILLGVVPPVKSELESAILRTINQAVMGVGWRYSLDIDPPKNYTDWLEGITFFLFGRVPTVSAIFIYFLIALFAFWIELLSRRSRAELTKEIFQRLRGEGLKKGLEVDPYSLPSLPNISGQYAIAIQQGASNLSNTYSILLEAGETIFSLTTTIILIITRSWIFAICCLLFVGLQVFVSWLEATRLFNKREKLDKSRNDLLARTDDILSKREIILAFEQQNNYKEELDVAASNYAQIEKELDIAEKFYQRFSLLITDFGRIAILFVALLVVYRFGSSQIKNIGDAYFLVSIYVRIFVPASNLLGYYESIKRSEATSKTFFDVLSASQPTNSCKIISKPLGENAIRFENVFFSYTSSSKEGKWILKDCSFHVPANKTTLILGKSGSGKTTIARILLGFWPITSGSVSINGPISKDLDSVSVRKLMSYVSQGDHIVEDTVGKNLSWGYSKGDNKISEDEMLNALYKVGLIQDRNNKDFLSMSAKKLSMGQQQRLSIARMMLDESDIVIIDEPLAGVDVFTFRELLKPFVSELQDKQHTVLMISHRLAFSGYVDHVVILGDEGAIVEEGDPRILLKTHGSTFSKLYEAAVSEFNMEGYSST